MANRLAGLEELNEYLSKWRKNYSNSFRLDGKPTIGPANPAQWVFFEVKNFEASAYSGLELRQAIDGLKWNGIYYLTASAQASSIQEFLDLYKKHNGDPNQIFRLGYTVGKENISTKRKLFLQSSDEINSGWFCKQHVNNSWER